MKLVILDRDGVINRDSDKFIRNVEEWVPIPESLEAIARLNKADYKVAVATNQSGLARGYFDLHTLNAIHARMQKLLAKVGAHIDILVFCPHGPDDQCDCRKPKPGLYREIGHRMGMPLQGIPVIGDSLRDLEAAMAVNAKPILVRTGKGITTENSLDPQLAIPVMDDLSAAVDQLLTGNFL